MLPAFLSELPVALTNSPYFSGLVMIVLNAGTSYLMQDLAPAVNQVFQHRWMRRAVFFAIFFTATRNFAVSVVLTVVAAVSLDLLLNPASRFCLLPRCLHSPALHGQRERRFRRNATASAAE